jgi:hypothetical protein
MGQKESEEWKRFEDAVGKLLNAPPQHKSSKPAPKPTKKKVAKKRGSKK